MPEKAPTPASANFCEVLRAEITIPGLDVAGEQTLLTALSALSGVQSVDFSDKKALITYNPLQVTEKQLAVEITRRGQAVTQVEAQRESLFPDAAAPEA